MSSELPRFGLHFATDKSLPFVIDIHNNSENLTLHPPPKIKPKLIGSQKRKRSMFEGYRPEKFDGKQFRTAFLQGNETNESIAAMKAQSSQNQIDNKFYEEQTKFCENYLNEFLKDCKHERAAEMKHNSREAATRLYEAVEFEDLPLDVPQIAAEQIIKRTKKLKNEYKKVSELAEKCVNDIVENMFEDNGAGSFVAQTLMVGDSLTKKKVEKPQIHPDFNYLTYHGSYRILSYYQLFNPYCFTYPMHYNIIPSGFEKHGYHPSEEIFQAVGTSRLGINDLDPPGQRNFVDDIYVPYLYSYWTNDMDEEISYPEILASPNPIPATTGELSTEFEEKEESQEFETLFLPSSSSSLKIGRQKSVVSDNV
uniref:Uncharacterized protein n=1 Tax=Panagrolaimus superbus TaxID=310955 RepID=A0A914YF93_9BILA